jgi:glycosyltransferase involved in cell wall biosynthesis
MSRVTIITPTCNRDLTILRRCISSVRSQTMPDWDQLICSDGQYEPAVDELVLSTKDERIRYCYLTDKRGHYGAGVRAALLDQARGRYLAFLDDDNMLFPKYLERMTDALEAAPDVGFAICQIVHYGPLAYAVPFFPVILNGIPPRLQNIDTLQVVVRRTAMLQTGWVLGGYCSDGYTFEKLGQEHRWLAIDEVLGIHF